MKLIKANLYQTGKEMRMELQNNDEDVQKMKWTVRLKDKIIAEKTAEILRRSFKSFKINF